MTRWFIETGGFRGLEVLAGPVFHEGPRVLLWGKARAIREIAIFNEILEVAYSLNKIVFSNSPGKWGSLVKERVRCLSIFI